MTYLESNRRFDYIVTVNDFADLETIYDELESHLKAPANTTITRSVYCKDRRPSSRNTTYSLTHGEAEELRNNPLVKMVTIHKKYMGITAGTFEDVTDSVSQSSTAWDKSGNTTTPMKNWGLLRCIEGENRSNWGSNGTQMQTGSITLGQTGKNVDVVVTDADGISPGHPEYQVNSDGTGGTRVKSINWCQWNPEVTGTAVTNYSYNFSGYPQDHPLHVAGTVAGNTQGWARDANIYNIYYDASPDFNTWTQFDYVMDYIRAFHRHKEVNSETGRKNPTLSTNSWGQSIFPSEWSFSDITAVTYRGQRHTPVTSVAYSGLYGICSATTLLATFDKKENAGYRLTTFGDLGGTPPSITDIPSGWVASGPGQATYTASTRPASSSYTVTLTGPADIAVLADIAVVGSLTIFDIGITVTIREGETVLFQDTETQTLDGFYGDGEVLISKSYQVTGTGPYTITFDSVTEQDDWAGYDVIFDVHVVTPGSYSADTTEIANVLLNTSSMTNIIGSIPFTGSMDDGFGYVALPFNIRYLGGTYSGVYVCTNGYLTFGGGSDAYYGLSYAYPSYPKIFWGGGDRRLTEVYSTVTGTAPNRQFTLHIGMSAAYSSTVTNMRIQYTFNEHTPETFDIQTSSNGLRYSSGGFSTEQLNAWGFIAGKRIPMRVPGLDADVEDAQKEGIIFVGAAGNGSWKHDLPGGLDWDNTFEMAQRYPASVQNPYYYMRGSSPTAVESIAGGGDFDLNTICVGSIDVSVGDYKASYSDCGPGVDVYSPGTNIISCLYNYAVVDPRSNSYGLGKFSGTSMATPQVAGVLACALELYPYMNQDTAKRYILNLAKHGQITETHGGPADLTDLQGSVNLYLYYKNEVNTTGQVYPRNTHLPQPSSGQIYPRVNRRRR